MSDFATALLTAIGLVFVIEGLAYALFPEGAQRLAALMQSFPPESLRRGGLLAVLAGALLVWLVRG